VKVETVNGVVTLTGTVASQAEHDKAVRVTQQIKGVKRVDAAGLKVAAAAAKR
jgi:hyperosmotically inducible protein